MSRQELFGIPSSRIKEMSGILQGVDKRLLLTYGAKVIWNLPKILNSRSLSPVYGALSDEDSTFHFFGYDFVVGQKYFSGIREMYCREVYTYLPEMKLGPDDVCVDLGANAGLFSLMAAKVGKRVVSVEAQSGFIPIIQAHLQKNGCLDKAEVLHGIIGSSSGVFSLEERRNTATHYKDHPREYEMAEIVEKCGGSIDFMKMDIEGSEFALFEGDLNWLSNVRRLAMEVHPDFGSPALLTKALKQYDFFTICVDSEQRLVGENGQVDYIYASKEPLSLP